MATGLIRKPDCSSSSPAISAWKTSIWRTTRAAPCQWTWCSGRERTQRSQVVKQADVVALLGLLPEEFTGESGGGELPLLRASLQPRQFAEPRHAWARRGPAGLLRNGAALLPADRGDRSRGYPCGD